jgi:hypothetical protein
MMVNLQNILLWEEDEVLEFLSALGYPGYSDQIRAEGITGELLIHCNHEALKDIGIHSVVRRRIQLLHGAFRTPLFQAGSGPPSGVHAANALGRAAASRRTSR